MKLTFYRNTGAKKPYKVVPPPTGTIVSYAGSSAPVGWLICDGTVVSATTYPSLNTVVANGFNTGGEGAGNFRLPNFSARSPMGTGTGTGGATSGTGQITGGSALTARTLGQQVGATSVTLTAAESGFPTHKHAITESNHGTAAVSPQGAGSHPISTNTSHTHQYGMAIGDPYKSGSSNYNYFPEWISPGSGSNYSGGGPSGSTYTISSASSNITDGAGTPDVVGYKSASALYPHPNSQPSLVLNFIIKT
jgi:microcystin-dependent protein